MSLADWNRTKAKQRADFTLKDAETTNMNSGTFTLANAQNTAGGTYFRAASTSSSSADVLGMRSRCG